MTGVGLGLRVFCRAHTRGKEHLSRDRRPLQESITHDCRTRQRLHVVAKHPAFRVDIRDLLRVQEEMARLQAITLTLPPGHIAARGEVVAQLQFQRAVDASLPAALEGKIVQQRRGAELPGIGKEVAEFIPAGELQRGVAIQRMVAADLEVVRPLGPDSIVGRVLRLSLRAGRCSTSRTKSPPDSAA